MNTPQSVSTGKPGSTGVLLVGHGTRDTVGLAEFWSLEQQLRSLAGATPLAGCFLEIAEPGISAGLQELLAQGVQRVVVLPLLLFAAGHAKRDIPEAVRQALAGRPGINVLQTEVLADHRLILELSAQRFQQAWQASLQTTSPAHVLTADAVGSERVWVLVGRGNQDAAAQADLRRFAEQRKELLPGWQTEICFYALADPLLKPTLQRIAASPARQIVVQPHLLFHGEVLQGIAQATAEVAEQAGHRQQWVLTEPLGPDLLLAQALWDLIQRAI